jgi:hypothetical protein
VEIQVQDALLQVSYGWKQQYIQLSELTADLKRLAPQGNMSFSEGSVFLHIARSCATILTLVSEYAAS